MMTEIREVLHTELDERGLRSLTLPHSKGISGKRPTTVGEGCLALESTVLSSEVMKHC